VGERKSVYEYIVLQCVTVFCRVLQFVVSLPVREGMSLHGGERKREREFTLAHALSLLQSDSSNKTPPPIRTAKSPTNRETVLCTCTQHSQGGETSSIGMSVNEEEFDMYTALQGGETSLKGCL